MGIYKIEPSEPYVLINCLGLYVTFEFLLFSLIWRRLIFGSFYTQVYMVKYITRKKKTRILLDQE